MALLVIGHLSKDGFHVFFALQLKQWAGYPCVSCNKRMLSGAHPYLACVDKCFRRNVMYQGQRDGTTSHCALSESALRICVRPTFALSSVLDGQSATMCFWVRSAPALSDDSRWLGTSQDIGKASTQQTCTGDAACSDIDASDDRFMHVLS